jgi:hypothetical protein
MPDSRLEIALFRLMIGSVLLTTISYTVCLNDTLGLNKGTRLIWDQRDANENSIESRHQFF